MSDLVGNPEDRFSRVEAQMKESHFCVFILPTFCQERIESTEIVQYRHQMH